MTVITVMHAPSTTGARRSWWDVSRLPFATAMLALLACGQARGEDPVISVPGGDAERGKVALHAYGCVACHRIPGVRGAVGEVGPPLDHWALRSYIAGVTSNSVKNLLVWIQVPQAVVPGTAMPNLGVSEADARDIAAYLFTLR